MAGIWCDGGIWCEWWGCGMNDSDVEWITDVQWMTGMYSEWWGCGVNDGDVVWMAGMWCEQRGCGVMSGRVLSELSLFNTGIKRNPLILMRNNTGEQIMFFKLFNLQATQWPLMSPTNFWFTVFKTKAQHESLGPGGSLAQPHLYPVIN